MINDNLYKRGYIISAIVALVVFIYILRLFSMQIMEDKYKDAADSNAFLKRTLYPPRGLIYDRNGELLVYNQPAYDIMLIKREMPQDFDTIDFCSTLDITKEEFIERIHDLSQKRGYSRYTPQIFMTQLSMENIAKLQEKLYKFPGFSLQNRTLRDYTYPSACHVLGSIGEVSQSDIDADDYYKRGDYAGRDGIEYTYEKQLRGEKGVEILLRDARGRIKGRLDDGKYDIAPKAGENLTLTIDIKLQMEAETLLSGKIG